MHTPGSAAHNAAHHHAIRTHHAAHHRALDSHHAAHRAAVDHARWAANHGRQAAFGAQSVRGGMPGWTAPRGGSAAGGRAAGVGGLLRFVLTLAVVAVVVGVVLLVLRPTEPEWLAHVVHELDGLVRTLRSAVA